jgi:uncharacterized protein
VYDFYHGGAAD